MISFRRIGAAVLSGAVLAIALSLGAAAPASAHAQVISSSPSDGQRVETSPKALTFLLSEKADLTTAIVTITAGAGSIDALGTPVMRSVNDVGRETIDVPVKSALTPGLYRVTFTAASAIDGHTASSEFIFGVQTDVSAPLGDESQSSSASVADRIRSLLQGITLIGAGIAFGLLMLSPVAGGRGNRAALVVSVLAGVAALLGGVIWHTGNGLVVAATGAIGAALLAVLAIVPTAGSRARLWLIALGLVVAVAPLALVGHAAAQGTLMTTFSALHVVTTAAWAGSVIAAAFLIARGGRRSRASILSRTSLVASVTFLISLITGLLLANGLVPSVAGLFGSLYGWGLVAKVTLVIPVLLLAIWTRTRLRSGKPSSVVLEASLLGIILVLGVLVASQPPPAAEKFQPTPSWQADTAAAGLNADDLLVSVRVDPNTPGSRFLVIRVDNTRRPSPGEIIGVKAALGADAPVALEKAADGLWTTRIDVTSAGPQAIHVEVSRPQLPVAIANSTWTVAPTRGTLVGGAALGAYIGIAIAGLVSLTLLGLVLEGFLGRRRVADADGELDSDSSPSDPDDREPVSV